MDFRSLIDLAGVGPSLYQLATAERLSVAEMDRLVTTVSPLLIGALQLQMKTPNGRNALRQLIRSGGPQQFIDRPLLLAANIAEMEGQQYLRQLLGSDVAVEAAASSLSESSEIQSDTVKHLLPRLASLFVGALCKKIGANL